jgi:outer membrane protein OmpA-like peptidoglycan-associated protein
LYYFCRRFKKELIKTTFNMKIARTLLIGAIALAILPGCSTASKTANGTGIGAGAGAALGAIAGALIGHDAKGAAIGAAIGTAVGAGTGAVIGKKMDKKAEELSKLENAQVETVTDQNGLEAIKVTFASGILFPTNGTTLSATSKKELSEFASKMSDMTDTDITIYGQTDNTGTLAVNERISAQRASAVGDYLKSLGIAANRITTEGKAYNEPVASNETAEGRAQNRRVEVYISANEAMVQAANNGTLK